MNIVRAIYKNSVKKLLILACCVPFAASAIPMGPSLLGDSINILTLDGTQFNDVTVGAGIEIGAQPFENGSLDYDVGASSITITNIGEPIASAFGFMSITDLDWDPASTTDSFTWDFSELFEGDIFTSVDSASAVSATFLVGATTWDAGGSVTLNIGALVDDPNGDVPEPTTLALLGLGLAGLGATRGRRRR